jgi:hypothetical protein
MTGSLASDNAGIWDADEENKAPRPTIRGSVPNVVEIHR